MYEIRRPPGQNFFGSLSTNKEILDDETQCGVNDIAN